MTHQRTRTDTLLRDLFVLGFTIVKSFGSLGRAVITSQVPTGGKKKAERKRLFLLPCCALRRPDSYRAMDLDAAEDNALLLAVTESDRALYKELEEEEKQEEEWPPRVDKKRRRRLRLHRMDIACLAVVGLVACIITVRQPALRTENPLLYLVAKKAPAPILPDFVTYADVDVGEHRAYQTWYKARGFEVDGHATLLFGTDFPYARTAPETWETLLQQAKHDGNNIVAVDVSWEEHESTRGVFNLAGGANLTQAYELAANVGVFVHVRFHPRGCSQTVNTAGDSEAISVHEWKAEVERFMTVMVAVSRPFLASNGGPIIMAELVSGDCASADGTTQWTGDLLGLLNTSTPWITYVCFTVHCSYCYRNVKAEHTLDQSTGVVRVWKTTRC